MFVEGLEGRCLLAGDLDLGFGTDGIVRTSLAGDSEAQAVAIQTDGKIVVAGRVKIGSQYDLALLRYDARGELDTAFGVNGMVTAAIPLDSALSDIAIQSDGKIVVAATVETEAGDDVVVARFTTSGGLDSAFGSDGVTIVVVNASLDDRVSAIALGSSGQIHVVGSTYVLGNAETFFVVQLTTDGAIERVTKDQRFVAGQNAQATDTLVDPLEGLVIAGATRGGAPGSEVNAPGLARYIVVGTRDATFEFDAAASAAALASEGRSARFDKVYLQPGGTLLAAGTIESETDFGIGIAKFTSKGVLDAAFGSDGAASAPSETSVFDRVIGLGQRSDGRISVAATTSLGVAQGVVIAQWEASGKLDASRGGDGTSEIPFSETATNASAAAMDADGAFAVVGSAMNAADTQFASFNVAPSAARRFWEGTPSALNLAGQFFAQSVATNGVINVISAPSTTVDGQMNQGEVLVYDAQSGNLRFKLKSPLPGAGQLFGWDVAVSEDRIVVGALRTSVGTNRSGAVFVFDAATGALVTTIRNTAANSTNFNYGWSVAISGNRIAVGALSEQVGTDRAGRVRIYDAATGALISTISDPTPDGQDQFGRTVDIEGDKVVVSSYENAFAKFSGVVHVFDAASGQLLRTIVNPTPSLDDGFSYDLAIDNGTIAVSGIATSSLCPILPPEEYGSDDPPCKAADIYLFDANSGELEDTVVAPSLIDHYGQTIALNDGILTIGSPSRLDQYDLSSHTFITLPNVPHVSAMVSVASASHRILFSGANPNGDPAVGSRGVFEYDVEEQQGYSIAKAPGASPQAFAAAGDRVLVGMPHETSAWRETGGAIVYRADNGQMITRLSEPQIDGLEFGAAVAISDRWAIVGAPGEFEGNNGGSVYVYDLNSATPGAVAYTLSIPTADAGTSFGAAVAIDGDRLVVGAPNDATQASGSGASYYFDLGSATPASPRAIYNPSDAINDHFGTAVAIRGTTIFVAAYLDDTDAIDAGSVYAIDALTGNALHQFASSQPLAGAHFGSAIAVENDRLLIGAAGNSSSGQDAGTAFLFDVISGAQIAELSHPVITAGDRMGTSLALRNGIAVVGAPFHDHLAADSGIAIAYQASNGALLEVLGDASPVANRQFGSMVAIASTEVFVGSDLPRTTTDPAVSAMAFLLDTAPNGLTLLPASIAENSPIGSSVGQLLARDPNGPADMTYEFVSGQGDADNALFTVAGNELRVGFVPNYETRTQFQVRIKATDEHGDSFTRSFDIHVEDIAETPGLTGDLSGDGRVDQADAARLLTLLGAHGEPFSLQGDLNDDGQVDLHDLLALQRNLSAVPPDPAPAAADAVFGVARADRPIVQRLVLRAAITRRKTVTDSKSGQSIEARFRNSELRRSQLNSNRESARHLDRKG
jgi:uncharacterized delta-60 repeat protein